MAITIPFRVTVQSPVYGGNQPPTDFAASRVELSWSWGLQPATAKIDWVSAATNLQIVPLAQLTIVGGGHTFYGFTEQFEKTQGSGGTTWMQFFQDSRALLQYDTVKGLFNRRDWRQEGAVFVKRYKHILPVNADRRIETYTDFPYTAAEILDFLFDQAKLTWNLNYVAALYTPIYDIDFLGGAKLGTAVQTVSERAGCTFTLKGGRYRLEWCVKGVGALPLYPPGDNYRTGQRMSGHPSRIEIRGERNLYQVLDVPLVPDWLPAWEWFYDPFWLASDLIIHESTEAALGDIPAGTPYLEIEGDEDLIIAWQLAFARARVITVEEYAKLRDARTDPSDDGLTSGEPFRDQARYQGRSRLNMTAHAYITELLWQVYRVRDDFALLNASGQFVPLNSLTIVPTALVELTHDPATGLMEYDANVKAEGNGYAIARGYQLGKDSFRTLRPEHFKWEQWRDYQDLWQHIGFQIDDSGWGYQTIIFDEPVIRSDDLFVLHNGKDEGDDTETGGYPVLNANPTIQTPAVRAALVFAAEEFSYTQGLPPRDEIVNEPGIVGQYVVRYGGLEFAELAYADGATALDKAVELASSLLLRQSVYDAGGFETPIPLGYQLTPVVDRVSVTMDPEKGYTESVDWTAERRSPNFEPERDYERKQSLLNLLPGERRAREEAAQARILALGLKHSKEFKKTLNSSAALLFGQSAPETFQIEDGAGPLPVGTPIWKEPAPRPIARMPAATTSTDTPVLAGITLLHNEEAGGPVRLAYDGDLLVRVNGLVGVNASLGFAAGKDYLVAGGAPAVATALQANETTETKLIIARFGSGGSAKKATWRPS